MSETDMFVSQEHAVLGRAKWLLRKLTYEYESGLTADELGVHCIYCKWQDVDVEAEVEHEASCPIEEVRVFLWPEDCPYPKEGKKP